MPSCKFTTGSAFQIVLEGNRFFFLIGPNDGLDCPSFVVDVRHTNTTIGIMSEVLSIKLSISEKEQLRRVAEKRQLSMSALLRQGLDQVLKDSHPKVEGSCYDKAAAYFENPEQIGASGVGDLSHNKKHLEGFGK